MCSGDWSSDVCVSDPVVNGAGTAGRARLPIEDVKMAGKTGTAQVVSLSKGSGKGGPWKYRDHGLFIAFAPFDAPRYAAAVVIEHGGGSGAARSDEHTSELQSLMRTSYAVFCLK